MVESKIANRLKTAINNLESNYEDEKKDDKTFISLGSGYAEATLKNLIFDLEKGMLKVNSEHIKKDELINYLKVTLVESEKFTKKINDPIVKSAYKLGVIKAALGILLYLNTMKSNEKMDNFLEEKRNISLKELNNLSIYSEDD
jgi:hypothetical protein